jgi:hypothetical protein
MVNKQMSLLPCVLALAALLAPVAASRSQEIDNAATYALANQLADELELVRERMGRPYDDSPRLPVSEISELELYYHAQSLLRKANQLAEELAGAAPRPQGPVPSGEISPADVYGVLEDSLEQIRVAAQAIGITEQVEPIARGPSISATGVFLIVIDINRQLNLMLRVPISDAEVFDEISTAVTYAASMLSMYPQAVAVPEAPPFDGYKRPADVYRLLTECMDAVIRVAPKAGVHVLGLSSRRNVPDDIEPGHAYDIARLLVADLAAFAATLNAPRMRAPLPTPKHIFPTEVYAQAGILLTQLEELERRLGGTQ